MSSISLDQVLVTVFYVDGQTSRIHTTMSRAIAIEAYKDDDPDIFDVHIQVWEKDNSDDTKA